MLRDGTAAGTAFAAVVEQTNRQVVFLYRTTTGGTVTTSAAAGDASSAKYVKLTRVGNTFSAFYSTNGTTWTALASPVSITMSATLKAGLCDSSANTSSATSAAFIGATVINDNTAPTLTSDSYLFSTALNKLSFTFSEDVSASLSTGSLSVITSPGGSPITVTAMSYDTPTNTATFTLATPLADGNYLATLAGPTTADPVGNTLVGGNAQLPFFVLAGDINRDGTVNALDFNMLATNFGSAGGFALGDVDFNGTINTSDFAILAAHFGSHVTPGGSASILSMPAPASLFSTQKVEATPLDTPSDPLSSL